MFISDYLARPRYPKPRLHVRSDVGSVCELTPCPGPKSTPSLEFK